jgi:DNA helicase-2/ATP-dependent DNA helicase PcrA
MNCDIGPIYWSYMGEMKLNEAQKVAADHIYGPLLVLAGPGTGKTQLLSARIANILTKTDASPQNILCLTFTENAALNMRSRLTTIIGPDAYDVHIATYHGFGSDIIRTYPQYFEEIDLDTGKDSRLERPIDALQRIQILTDIISRLPFNSPLIGARHYVKNVSQTISELKRYSYSPNRLKEIAEDNLLQVKQLSPFIADHLSGIKTLPGTADKSIALFGPIQEHLEGKGGLASEACEALGKAMSEAMDMGKSKPLTDWKNEWLHKDNIGKFELTDPSQHYRLLELAKIYQSYQDALDASQLYDFEDMILRVIEVLKTNDELRFNLQEKYQFILLDEFQDTNTSQFDLVKELANNPVNENQPNIFAVGDDDQAIYAFQGARVSNMMMFKQTFDNVKTLSLTENYRSHPDILHVAHNLAEQIETRLHKEIGGVTKNLVASSSDLPKDSIIERHEFSGEANELSWVAARINTLIKGGVKPHEIAVLAPQHKYLESIVPFLAHNHTPITYEKRENILDTPMVRSFRLMIELIAACESEDIQKMNELLPRVLSLDFYQIPIVNIWRVNWELKRRDTISWAEYALSDEVLAPHVAFYLGLGMHADSEPLEYMLDYLTGTTPFFIDAETQYISPLRNYYFNTDELRTPSTYEVQESDATSQFGITGNALRYFEMLANLSTIREHLRAWQSGQDKLLHISDFLRFVQAYEQADESLINSHPIALADDSVQLMTTFKAKGLEFEHVFMLSVHDDVWGKGARSSNNKVGLPANLTHIRHAGGNEDELRRILFVAITRAKHGLYLTSHAHKDNGKSTEPIKYFKELEEDGVRKMSILPSHKQLVNLTSFNESDTMQAIDLMWNSRHLNLDASLKSLLKDRLERYRLSPTHLNKFIDTEYGGPQEFLLSTLLRFPQAPGEDGEYGNSVHHALEQHQNRLNRGSASKVEHVLKDFDHDLAKRYITHDRMDDYRERGHYALKAYLSKRNDMFVITAQPEVAFHNEGVVLGNALLGGKIDRLEINKANKTVQVVDYKTGKGFTRWEKELKLLKYKQQLYMYKFLLEGSHTWQNYKVVGARLEFVEPLDGVILPGLEITFDSNEEAEMKLLIAAMWEKVQALDLPDISEYSQDYKGAQEFIASLI